MTESKKTFYQNKNQYGLKINEFLGAEINDYCLQYANILIHCIYYMPIYTNTVDTYVFVYILVYTYVLKMQHINKRVKNQFKIEKIEHKC